MRGFSKAIVTGNITRDPELRTTPNGANVVSFSVAVNRVYRDNAGNNQESVSFIDCTAWGKPAEIIAQYARKGTGMLVSGRLEQRSWEDKTTGQKRSRTEIIVEDFNFIGGGNDSRNGGGSAGFSDGGTVTGSDAAAVAAAAVAGNNGDSEVVPLDVPADDSIDLGEIPF